MDILFEEAPGTDWFRESKHGMVSARAGTGKTSTFVEGTNRLYGKYDLRTKFTDQQLAIFDQIADYDGGGKVRMLTFGHLNADELKRKVYPEIKASTFHAYGAYVCNRRLSFKKNDYKIINIVTDVLGSRYDELYRLIGRGIRQLVDLARYNLIETMTIEQLVTLSELYDVELNEKEPEEVVGFVNETLNRCRNDLHQLDYTDMLYLPVINGWIKKEYGLVCVDEWQDTNVAQQEMARAMGDTICLSGDPFQSVYAFAGADWRAYDRMVDILTNSGNGMIQFPLTQSFRCGRAIVEEAQKIVKDIESWPGVKDGSVERREVDDAEFDDALVLCRTNAPLVKVALRLAKKGKTVWVAGHDIGTKLVDITNTVIRMGNPSTPRDFQTCLTSWYTKAEERANKRQSTLRATKRDDYEVLLEVSSACTSIGQIEATLRKLFSDNEDTNTRLMSIHRAKGLEHKKVILWGENLLPSQYARTEIQIQQESNLKYVGITRAKEELIITEV